MIKNMLAVFMAAFVVVLATAAVADGVNELGRLIGDSDESAASAPAATAPLANRAPLNAALLEKEDKSVLRLTPDRSRVVKLDRDAASVIVANPVHAAVALESARVMVIMPRQPGTTGITVLDSRGEVIFDKTIVVSNADEQYVRVRRVCGAEDRGCVPFAYYYCPDGCYEVSPTAHDPNSQPPAAVSPPGAAGAPNNENVTSDNHPVTPTQPQEINGQSDDAVDGNAEYAVPADAEAQGE